jgi:2'-5' RNA ligase
LKPKSWVPHITISFSRAKFKENLKELRREKISFETRVNTLYLIKKHARGDYMVLKRFKLQTK